MQVDKGGFALYKSILGTNIISQDFHIYNYYVIGDYSKQYRLRDLYKCQIQRVVTKIRILLECVVSEVVSVDLPFIHMRLNHNMTKCGCSRGQNYHDY